MRIDFASSFDFDDYPHNVSTTNRLSIGHMRLGQKGLLNFFENYLGLYSKEVHKTVRIRAYEQAIALTLGENPNLYISKSYAIDSWGVANQLLKWRDELVLANYEFDVDNALDVSKRLYTLCLVEQNANDVPAGRSDKWLKVLETILERKVPPINELHVYEQESHIHPFFKHLFETLERKSIKVIWEEFTRISNSTDLGQFQKKLSDSSLPKINAVNDGSLIVLKAFNDNVLAEYIGEMLVDGNQNQPILILPDRGELLETALINRGLPAIGYRTTESNGSIEQLLHLITVFLWNPLNPQKLLQYLSHPIAPIPKGLRVNLATTYSRKSSISSTEWNEKIDDYTNMWPEKSKSVKQNLDKWFNRPTANISKGANQKDVISLYEDLAKWAGTSSSITDGSDAVKRAFIELGNQCKQLISIVKDFTNEDEPISELQLNKWIESVDSSYLIERNLNEIGAVPFITEPANLTLRSKSSIWWNFINTDNPVKYAADWTTDELKLLKDKFIHSKESIVNQWFWQQSLAVHMTESKLILCIPDKVKGEVQEAHPLYYDLLQTFSNPDLIDKRIELDKFTGNGNRTDTIKEYPKKSLPIGSTHWEINPVKEIEKREYESYSSLVKLFYYPHDYFLNYHLGIRETEIPNITISPRLFGNLVHSAVHQLWSDENILDYKTAEIVQKIAHQVKSTIQEEGSILLLPEHEISLSEFSAIATKSIRHLFEEVKKNQWSFLGSEQRHQVKDEISILGDLDLVLKRSNDEYVIVDLKWGSFNARREELINEQELQLMIYNNILKANGRKIHLCYYVITKQLFLSRSNEAFSNSRVIRSNKSIDAHNQILWNKMISTYTERYKELNRGKIEVGVGLSEKQLAEISQIWSDETNRFLKVPIESKKKKVDKYSSYNKIVGRI